MMFSFAAETALGASSDRLKVEFPAGVMTFNDSSEWKQIVLTTHLASSQGDVRIRIAKNTTTFKPSPDEITRLPIILDILRSGSNPSEVIQSEIIANYSIDASDMDPRRNRLLVQMASDAENVIREFGITIDSSEIKDEIVRALDFENSWMMIWFPRLKIYDEFRVHDFFLTRLITPESFLEFEQSPTGRAYRAFYDSHPHRIEGVQYWTDGRRKSFQDFLRMQAWGEASHLRQSSERLEVWKSLTTRAYSNRGLRSRLYSIPDFVWLGGSAFATSLAAEHLFHYGTHDQNITSRIVGIGLGLVSSSIHRKINRQRGKLGLLRGPALRPLVHAAAWTTGCLALLSALAK